jgi:hypothetical protein
MAITFPVGSAYAGLLSAKSIARTTSAKTTSPVSLDFFIYSNLPGRDENIHPPVAGKSIQHLGIERLESEKSAIG